jgi:O-antigen/teichoic acid export membrane protein
MWLPNGHLIRSAVSAIGGVPDWRWAEMLSLAKEYRRFPMYSAPAGLANVGNINLMNFALPILLTPATLGYYSLAMRVLGAPVQQVAGPIGQVFMREAAEELQRTGSARRSFIKGALALGAISVVFFGALAMVVEPAFAIIFGAEWSVAGRYAAIMMPLFAVRFVVSPLTTTAGLTDNRFGLAFNLVLLFAAVIVLWQSSLRDWSAEILLNILTYVLGFLYLAYMPVLFWLAGSKGRAFRRKLC